MDYFAAVKNDSIDLKCNRRIFMIIHNFLEFIIILFFNDDANTFILRNQTLRD